MSGHIRTPVAACFDPKEGEVTVVCDDGAVFSFVFDDISEPTWHALPSIPGTLAAIRQANGDRTLEADLVEDR